MKRFRNGIVVVAQSGDLLGSRIFATKQPGLRIQNRSPDCDPIRLASTI